MTASPIDSYIPNLSPLNTSMPVSNDSSDNTHNMEINALVDSMQQGQISLAIADSDDSIASRNVHVVNQTVTINPDKAKKEKQILVGDNLKDGIKLDRRIKKRLSGISAEYEFTDESLDVVLLSSEETTLLFKQKLLSLVHKILVPYTNNWDNWKSVSNAADLRLERISGAMTNCIFVVHGPFWYEGERRRKRRLLLRVYGVGTEQYFHREREIFWLDRLSKTGYGPKLLGVFTNGRFEEYLNCETLTKEDIRDPQISPLIASKLFDLHNMVNEFPPSPTSTRDRAEIWGAINKYFYMAMNGVDELLTVYPERKQILDSVKFSEFGSLIDSLKTRLSDVGSPIVFSHNDSQYGNILRHRKTGEIVLVDYEYAGYNYRGYDIANHFIEWTADYHCSTPHVLVPSRYPSQTEQIRFLKAYLDSFVSKFTSRTEMSANSPLSRLDVLSYFPVISIASQSHPKSEQEILQSLLTEVEMFTIVSHLMWGLWGLSREIDMLGRREIDFDYFGYGMQRLRWVVDNTDRILEIAK